MVNQFKGAVAEWLCSGLQLRVRRFDSDPRLQLLTRTVTARVAKLVDATDLKSVDLWSCGFKSRPGHQLFPSALFPSFLLSPSMAFGHHR